MPCDSKHILVCDHVLAGEKPEVLNCENDGSVWIAICEPCAQRIDKELEDQVPPNANQLQSVCKECALKNHNVPATMPAGGFWLLANEGTYTAQAPN